MTLEDRLAEALERPHVAAIGRIADGENCALCGAWSDAEWAKPCLGSDEARAEYQRKVAQMNEEL